MPLERPARALVALAAGACVLTACGSGSLSSGTPAAAGPAANLRSRIEAVQSSHLSPVGPAARVSPEAVPGDDR